LSLNSPKPQMSAWWVHAFHDPRYARQNIVIIKLLLNVYIYRKIVCPCCDMNCVNSVNHILFECLCNNDLRREMWIKVQHNSPEALFHAMTAMPKANRCIFILNAFYVNYLHEWKGVFDALSDFTYKMYMKYEEMYKMVKSESENGCK